MAQQTVSWRARAEHAADRYQELAQRRPLLGLPLTFVARYTARQGMLLASAVAFRMFLWLLPLTLMAAGILAGLSSSEHASTPESAAKTIGVTGAAGQQVVTALQQGHRSWWIAVLTGAVGLIWTTRTLTRNLVMVSGHLWQVRARRSPTKHALTTVAVVGLVLIAIVTLDAAMPRVTRSLPGGGVLTIIVEASLTTAGWLAISLRLPDGRRTWTDLLPGAVMLGLAMAFAHAAARVYVPHKIEHSSKLYGALGIAGVMMGWLLIVGQIVVACVLLNSMLFEYRRHEGAVPAGAPLNAEQLAGD